MATTCPSASWQRLLQIHFPSSSPAAESTSYLSTPQPHTSSRRQGTLASGGARSSLGLERGLQAELRGWPRPEVMYMSVGEKVGPVKGVDMAVRSGGDSLSASGRPKEGVYP